MSVSEHGDLVGAARQYLARLSAGGAPLQPRTAAFAVATAVREDCVRFTNSPWSFSQEAVRQALGLKVLRVVNDFEALALSLPGLVPGQMQGFPGGPRTPVPGLTLAVVGPGTGLGVGAVVPSVAGRWDALPGEGGGKAEVKLNFNDDEPEPEPVAAAPAPAKPVVEPPSPQDDADLTFKVERDATPWALSIHLEARIASLTVSTAKVNEQLGGLEDSIRRLAKRIGK